MVRIDKGVDDKLIEVGAWKETLEVGRAVKFSFGKGRDVTASKQDIGILAFFSGTALGQALGWMERRLIVGLELPIHFLLVLLSLCTFLILVPEYVAKTTSGMRTERLLRWSRHQASGPDEAERRSA